MTLADTRPAAGPAPDFDPAPAIQRLVSSPPAGGRLTVTRLDGTCTLPLTELYEQAGRLALHLRERGIGPGSRIGVLAANSLEWVLLDLAALRLKAQTAGLEPGKFTPSADLMERYGLDLLCTDQEVEGLPGALPMAQVRELADTPAAEPAPPPVSWHPQDVTTVKFTSGSTGVPKGLGATVGSIDSSLAAVQQLFGHGPDDHLFVFLPLSLLQQRYWVYSALLHGHDLTISTYEAAFAALRRTRPTVVMGVPAFFDTARRQIEARHRRAAPGTPLAETAQVLFGDRIRYLWTGSAPAAPAVHRFYAEAALPLWEGYGMNETCIVTKNHPGAHREGSVGQVLPGKQVLIDADGVIHVRASHPVGTRYLYAGPGDSEKVFAADGTVRTGDLGHLDADGFLFVHGRADDVIVLDNGKKIVVRPVEELMKADPAIGECVLFSPAQTELVAVVSPAAVPADHAAIAARLAAVNAATTADEFISRVIVAERPFSIDDDLLTSQYKPKRPQIRAAHATQLLDQETGIHA
ncbi:AMP-binding protein [Streptomyces sp. NPDC089919]|uniref:AMP-binding protein n=1 Tax=Streptomyces sp. NPDC089919 TaxID=3155188 RepID=UPI00344AA11F